MQLLIPLLFFLLPAYLIRFRIGSMPTTVLEVLIWIILLVWVIKEFRTRVFRQKLRLLHKNNNSLFFGIALFLIGATISIFSSVNIRAALGEWRAFYVEPILIFFVIISSPSKNQKNADTILFALIFSGLITSIFAIYQHFTGFLVPHSFWANRETYRVTAWYGFPNAVGMALAPVIPLALYLTKKNWIEAKKIAAICYLLSAICSTTAMIYAKSIGSLVGVVVGVGTLFLFNKKTRWPTIIIACATIFTLFFILPTQNPIRQKLLAQSFSGQLRQDIWAETTELLIAHPIKGAGLAAYAKVIYPYRINKMTEVFHHPHNLLLTIWVNTGLMGLIGFILILVWFFKAAIKHINNEAMKQLNNINFFKYLTSSMIIILVSGLVDSPYIKNDLAILFWLLPALLLLKMRTAES